MGRDRSRRDRAALSYFSSAVVRMALENSPALCRMAGRSVER